MTIGGIQLLMLVAAAQGILLGVLLLHKHRALVANRFLALYYFEYFVYF